MVEATTDPSRTGTTERSKDVRRWTAFIPPQHGAWAFLVVPLLVGFTVAPVSLVGLVFACAWVVAYPVGYFGGRAVVTRWRRGTWSRLARRELRRAAPWAVVLVVLAVPLVVLRPWLVLAAVAVALVWAGSMVIGYRGSERDLTNDAVLVALAVLAVPLVWLVTAGDALSSIPPSGVWLATAATAVFLFGSVLHVKSLLRRAGDVSFRRLTLGYHVVALAAFAVASPWWLVGFTPALLRVVVMRPGMRPAVIGAIETGVACCFVAAAALAA